MREGGRKASMLSPEPLTLLEERWKFPWHSSHGSLLRAHFITETTYTWLTEELVPPDQLQVGSDKASITNNSRTHGWDTELAVFLCRDGRLRRGHGCQRGEQEDGEELGVHG